MKGLVLGLFFLASQVEARGLAIEPARTWVFVVGSLEWKYSEVFPSFPKTARRDAELVQLLRTRGVPSTQIVYLQDRMATGRAIRSEVCLPHSSVCVCLCVSLCVCGVG